MNLTDIYRIFYPWAEEYKLLLAICGTFSKIDNILGHNVNLNENKKIEITSCISSGHNGVKLEMCSKRNHREYTNMETEQYTFEW
jgi:hypothetical protein